MFCAACTVIVHMPTNSGEGECMMYKFHTRSKRFFSFFFGIRFIQHLCQHKFAYAALKRLVDFIIALIGVEAGNKFAICRVCSANHRKFSDTPEMFNLTKVTEAPLLWYHLPLSILEADNCSTFKSRPETLYL